MNELIRSRGEVCDLIYRCNTQQKLIDVNYMEIKHLLMTDSWLYLILDHEIIHFEIPLFVG